MCWQKAWLNSAIVKQRNWILITNAVVKVQILGHVKLYYCSILLIHLSYRNQLLWGCLRATDVHWQLLFQIPLMPEDKVSCQIPLMHEDKVLCQIPLMHEDSFMPDTTDAWGQFYAIYHWYMRTKFYARYHWCLRTKFYARYHGPWGRYLQPKVIKKFQNI